jgi:hypothetical protein
MHNKYNEKKENLNEESLVGDLQESILNTIQDTSNTINNLIEDIEVSFENKKIPYETKEMLKNLSRDLIKSLDQTGGKLINKKDENYNFREEE